MSADEQSQAPGGGPGIPGGQGAGQPSEEELRERLDEELRKLRVQDVLLQSVVSLINLTSRRIAKEDEQDLDQARIGIDAIRALVDLLDAEPAQQVRSALSDLQMHYARAAGGGTGGEAEPAPQERAEREQQQRPADERKPPGLWTPPGT
jgi:hypothetical protein